MPTMVTPKIIYEDDNFLAIDKPAGVLVHSTQFRIQNSELKIKERTLVDWLVEKYPEIRNVGDEPETRPGIVHRLDKDTSGVMLVARNQKYFEYLKSLFSPYGRSPEGRQGSQIKKTYLALVWGKLEPQKGIIEKPIKIKAGSVKRTVWQGKDEKKAVTEYKVIKFFKLKVDKEKEQIFSLVEVMPKTGRTHQIRIHLSSIGHPIVGDSLYCKKGSPFGRSPVGRQFLHAESLEFPVGEGKRMKIEAELPEDLKRVIDELWNYK